MATTPFDAPEALGSVDDIVDPNEILSDGSLVEPSGAKGEAPQYISHQRSVSFEKRAVKKGKYEGKPFLSVTIEIESLEDQDGNEVRLRRPMKAWINTLRWPNGPGKVGSKPSSVDQYLEALGMQPRGMTGEDIKDALEESATIPVTVHVGWEERVQKDEVTGEYPDPRFKTGDFRKGPNGEFVESFTDEDSGEEIRARSLITYFSRV